MGRNIDNKGFTLVELVVTVAILLALATIAVISVTATLKKSKSENAAFQDKLVQQAIRNWAIDNCSAEICTINDGDLDGYFDNPGGVTIDYPIIVTKEGEEIVFNGELAIKILMDNPLNETTPDFSQVATTDEGLFRGVDADGETYYFRGAVEDNYVKIGSLNILWRIVRINGDGTIRLIANETIGKSIFNTSSDNENHGGYTYNNGKSCTTDSPCNSSTGESSTIKIYLENWYTRNMASYDSLIATTRYCNDTSKKNSFWAASDRLYRYETPTFKCPDTTETYGGEYKLKIGLLSADEAVFAGGKVETSNTSYYLNRDTDYWLGTPDFSDDSYIDIYGYIPIFPYGISDAGGIITNKTTINTNVSVVPVINLQSGILYTSGKGTITSPYKVNLGAPS